MMQTNCGNCGANLALTSYQDSLICEYCDTVHIPSIHEDAIIDTVSGLTSDTSCPLCDDKMGVGKIEQWKLLICISCRGLLVKQKELLKIILYARVKNNAPPRKPQKVSSLDLERSISCPSCAAPMTAHEYYGPGDFVIDSCQTCNLVWLDGGELNRAASISWGGSLWK